MQLNTLALFALLSALVSPSLGLVIRAPEFDPTASSGTNVPNVVDVEAAVQADILRTQAQELRKMTNGQRLAKGLGPLPPTRRSVAPHARRSGAPEPVVTSEEEPSDFDGPSVIRLRNPRDGSELGVITFPGGDDNGDLVNFDPNTGRAQRFQTGRRDAGQPFEIYPTDMDDSFFGGRTPLLGAKPRGRPNLGQGSPDFLHVGLATLDDDTNFLDIRLPSRLLAAKGPLGGLTSPLTGATGGSPLSGTPLGGGSGSPPLGGLGGDGGGGLINALLPGDLGGLTSGPGLGGLAGDQNYPAQGTIWTFDPRTRQLIAHYTRPDGQTVPTYFVTGGACQHLICLTADVDAFRNSYGDDAAEIHALVTVL